jgi:hypothetical protein
MEQKDRDERKTLGHIIKVEEPWLPILPYLNIPLTVVTIIMLLVGAPGSWVITACVINLISAICVEFYLNSLDKDELD